MLPEILGISVAAELVALAPATYSGFSAHAETVRQKKHDRKGQHDRKGRGADGKTRSFDGHHSQDETDQSSTQQHVSDLG